ncbi:hypothetical protein FQN57_004579 [Myotisia sp. PD_48]|nr:hypothetical protein FQN57_004579 [Myotisia sp. PD_48]
MIISSRRNLHEMSLRRTPTRSTFGPTPLSHASLRVPLLDSPLPSPGLPSSIPRSHKRCTPRWLKRSWRLLGWTGGLVCIYWMVLFFLNNRHPFEPENYTSSDFGSPFHMLEDTPDTPGPVLITDQRGRVRWTVLLPLHLDYPLAPSEYARICAQAWEMAHKVSASKIAAFHSSGQHGYYYADKNYMQIEDAKQEGLLPSDSSPVKNIVGAEHYSHQTTEKIMPICERSLTFVLQTEDAGLGATLMGLWMSYGLAKKESRAFFIDDTNWAYGRYTTYFSPPAMPSCRPAPVSNRTPYPNTARHLMVSSATIPWTFGHKFNDEFENQRKSGVERQREIFSLLRAGYEALFQLAGDDSKYLEYRTTELRRSMSASGGPLIGLHIRRGDRHPLQFQYQRSYIPLDVYTDAATDLVSSFFNKKLSTKSSINLNHNHQTNSHSNGNNHNNLHNNQNSLQGNKNNHNQKLTRPQFDATSRTIMASDDPDVYTASEMRGFTSPAQTYISLISKSILDAESSSSAPGMSSIHINVGWEGGFFNNIFWSLGAESPIPSAEGSPSPSQGKSSVFPAHRVKAQSEIDAFRFNPPSTALQLRELVGKAYLLDMAVLGQTDGVVCAVSTVSCRLLAVMLGWERAIEDGGWRNVDGNWHWRGIF